MRINVEDKVWTDLRFNRLARALKMPRSAALGLMLNAWYIGQESRREIHIAADIDDVLGVEGFSKAAVTADLFEAKSAAEVRIKGMHDRLKEIEEYHEKKRNAGKLGNAKRWANKSVDVSQTHRTCDSDAIVMPSQTHRKTSLSMSPSTSTSMSPSRGIEDPENAESQTHRTCDNEPASPPSAIASGVTLPLNDFEIDRLTTEIVEAEVLNAMPQKPKRKHAKRVREYSEHDIWLSVEWLKWAKEVAPHINATQESFCAAIFDIKKYLRTNARVDDVDGLLEAVFNFIQRDEFWGKVVISPGGLLNKSKNGLRKIDNIIIAMRGPGFRDKQRELISEKDGPIDLSWMTNH